MENAIRKAAASKSPVLSLRYLGVQQLPDAVLEMTHLEELRLVGNCLTSLPKGLERLPLLKRIDIRDNPIGQVASRPGLMLDWASYESLQKSIDPLHVLGLGFIAPALPEISLDRFPNLLAISFDAPPASSEHSDDPPPVFEIDGRDRRVIEKMLASARDLKELEFYCLGLGSVLEGITAHKNLLELSMIGNSIRSLPRELVQLRRLRLLTLSDNQIDVLPEELWALSDLVHLDLGNNKLQTVPPGIGQLRDLSSLILNSNCIESLPDTFANLKRLRYLNLEDNLFTSVPELLFDLQSITSLNLSAYTGLYTTRGRGNQRVRGTKKHPPGLTEIPRDILRLHRLDTFDIQGHHFTTPPAEVVKDGLEAIKSYWRQREDVGTDYLCEAKLLIVGEPGAGKTTLANKLLDPSYPLDSGQISTEGIDILRWEFQTTLRPKDGGPSLNSMFRVSIWDFGGQEIYHATHQFFLTRRSVYVLVADSRKEDTDFQYWLNVVELLSDRSPLIIVKNEKQDRRRDIDESGLRSRFKGLREVMAVNLDGNRGLEDLAVRIRQHLEARPHIGEALPATWKRVREALEQDSRDYISLQEYLRICEANGFRRLSDKLQLSGYLHDLGICLHFQDDLVLKNTVILKPKWGTDAVYRVLDDPAVIAQRGRFLRSALDSIWSEDQYAGMRDELLQLMVRFQLCYRLENSDAYVAPQLLTPEKPQYVWPSSGILTLKYRYDFMPKGIFTRLVVALNHLIADQSFVWRTGAILERDGTRCEVIEDSSRREIGLRAVGQYPREIIAIVDHAIGRIHDSFQHFKCETWVPCRCSSCSVASEPQHYPFDVLRRFARDEKPIQCHASYELVNARELVDAVLSGGNSQGVVHRDVEEIVDLESGHATESTRPTTSEVFVSYGWNDESDSFVDALSAAFDGRGVSLIRDKSEMTYKDSILRFMQRIGGGNAVVVVISRKYLESPNCMFELAEISDHRDFRDRVFPVILPDARVFDPESVLDYIKYWEDRIKSLDAKMRIVELTNLQGIQNELNLYRRIRSIIAEIVDVLRDMNVLSVKSNRDTVIQEVVKAVVARLKAGT